MRSLTAQGSAYTRFRRALDRGNVTEALSSAAELEHVGLAEALELCLLLADKAPQRFGRAAVRRHGRFCREAQVDLEEAQAVLAALASASAAAMRTRTRHPCINGPAPGPRTTFRRWSRRDPTCQTSSTTAHKKCGTPRLPPAADPCRRLPCLSRAAHLRRALPCSLRSTRTAWCSRRYAWATFASLNEPLAQRLAETRGGWPITERIQL
jgi:hypothetical protein